LDRTVDMFEVGGGMQHRSHTLPRCWLSHSRIAVRGQRWLAAPLMCLDRVIRQPFGLACCVLDTRLDGCAV
jgi:hypothetical protein